MMTRHEFLAELHRLLHPQHYLEIGVQTGASLQLASCPSIGIDPAYDVKTPLGPHVTLKRQTSDNYFTDHGPTTPVEDLVFIDGDHRFEQVLRDLMNVERYSATDTTLVVLDDVLPYSHAMAAREPCQGDWSGDAWKLWPILVEYRPFLELRLVDVTPAGLLLVRGLRRDCLTFDQYYDEIVAAFMDLEVPDSVLSREHADQPAEVLEWVKIK
jgi:hypothetical protein